MIFPVLEVPLLGGELLMAAISLVFAVSAFFAVGGGTFQVLLERRAEREGDGALLSFLQDWSRFFLLMTLIVGMVSWAGLWMTAAVVSPNAALALLKIFFWPCMAICALFVVQVAAAFLYHSTWGAVEPSKHLAIGWIFAGSAWVSLLLINGVLTFMLTPGDWLVTGRLRDAMFNQTFLPSAIMLVSGAAGVTGLICLIAGAGQENTALRAGMVKASAMFVLPGFILLPASAFWHTESLPLAMRTVVLHEGGLATTLLAVSLGLCLIVVLLGVTGPFRKPKSPSRATALFMLVLGLGAVSSLEWSRGIIRSPYVVNGYLYLNGIDPRNVASLREGGFLRRARYAFVKDVEGDQKGAGRELFRLQCMACHSVDGYNSVRRRVQGWSRDVLDTQLEKLEKLPGRMPPFAGTGAERRALAAWLSSLQRPGTPKGAEK
jgi:hypothetical protein